MRSGYKNLSSKFSLDLENEVKVTKTLSALKLVRMIHPGKFGGIPSTGSRNIVSTRNCHADADTDADANGIRTGTNMSPLTFGWEHNTTDNT